MRKSFYNQAKECALIGLEKLQSLNIPVERPGDYFSASSLRPPLADKKLVFSVNNNEY